jgi:hypothetical protein
MGTNVVKRRFEVCNGGCGPSNWRSYNNQKELFQMNFICVLLQPKF